MSFLELYNTNCETKVSLKKNTIYLSVRRNKTNTCENSVGPDEMARLIESSLQDLYLNSILDFTLKTLFASHYENILKI